MTNANETFLLADSPLIKLFIKNFPLPAALLINDTRIAANDAYEAAKRLCVSSQTATKHLRQSSTSKCANCLENEQDWKSYANSFRLGGNDVKIDVLINMSKMSYNSCALKISNKALIRENHALRSALDGYILELIAKLDQSHDLARRMLDYAYLDVNIVISCEILSLANEITEIIHKIGPRRCDGLIFVDCALRAEELEDIFFGASGGAVCDSLKNGSTLVLQNVEKLPLCLQQKLLFYFEDGKTRGDLQKRRIHIISIATQDLLSKIRIGEFDVDFFSYIHVGSLEISTPINTQTKTPAKDALIESGYSCGNDDISDDVLCNEDGGATVKMNLGAYLDKVEKDFILRVLEASGGKKEKAARLAGMNLRTFQRRCARFGL